MLGHLRPRIVFQAGWVAEVEHGSGFGFGADLLDKCRQSGNLLGLTAQVQAPHRRDHRCGAVAPDRVLAGVKQGFAQEAFVNEYAPSVGERDVVTGEAGEARAETPRRCR